jgi:hypothetical protein
MKNVWKEVMKAQFYIPPPYLPGEPEGKSYNFSYLGTKTCKRSMSKVNLSLCEPGRCMWIGGITSLIFSPRK